MFAVAACMSSRHVPVDDRRTVEVADRDTRSRRDSRFQVGRTDDQNLIAADAEQSVRDMCGRLLANPVTEDYLLQVEGA